MKAEIITIGDEILIGQIVDTNSVYIAKALTKIGIAIHQITSIEDERNHILNTLKEAGERVEVVIITGGLGPTKDDVTKACLCEFFQDELVTNTHVLKHIEHLFEKYIDTPISDLNRNQALLPSKATVLHNEYGTAAGMWFRNDKKVFISLPGVPYEMKALIDREVVPKLIQEFSRPVLLHKTVITYGLGESAIAEKIEDWENNLPNFIKLAYLPNLGRVRLRLSAKGENEAQLKDAIEKQITTLHEYIGDIIYGYEADEVIELQIARILVENKCTLATAESCTGGQIAARFTAQPGASGYFKGGIVSYATQAKTDILKITSHLISAKSVVSAEVTQEMALAAQKRFKSDFAIATTGNAGPSKGDSEAEVGTVFIAIAGPKGVHSEKFIFGNLREKVIGKSVNKALELLLKEVIQQTSKD